MLLVSTLILAPIAFGLFLAWIRPERLRTVLVAAAVAAVSVGVITLATLPSPGFISGSPFQTHAAKHLLLAAELLIALYIFWIGVCHKQPAVVILILVQTAITLTLEFTSAEALESARPIFIDNFAVLMALINGLVGGGICLYALGYMRGYHRSHPDVPDRRPAFFALLFLFMGAMFGIIFANSLTWMFLFWEITTLCSFLLIGYTRTPEARKNAFKALAMNLAGGVAFAGAIAFAAKQTGTVELQTLITSGKTVALLPAALLAFAGITKSAQLPFSGWLLGAMVAPTPVSALLHSSTMVKAGVYAVLRVAPILCGTTPGLMVALVGAITFLIGSLAAITTSDAKKLLAWSTVANLGLIVLCGGIGTSEALWAGVLLLIFHAIAKCLLFLCVGVVEHHTGSRDIESMSGLILNMPRVAIMMLIGMAGMFLAPFGMLISKWAVLKAVVDAYPFLVAFIVFGSAATLFFWVKWMGKLLEVVRPHQTIPAEFGAGESVALYGLSSATFLTCLLFPVLSATFIEPYVRGVYGVCASMSQGNVIIMLIMMVMIMLFPLSFINYGRGVKVMDAYLGGANLQSSVRFLGSANQTCDVAMNNYYLKSFFSESTLARWGVCFASLLLALMLAASLFP